MRTVGICAAIRWDTVRYSSDMHGEQKNSYSTTLEFRLLSGWNWAEEQGLKEIPIIHKYFCTLHLTVISHASSCINYGPRCHTVVTSDLPCINFQMKSFRNHIRWVRFDKKNRNSGKAMNKHLNAIELIMLSLFGRSHNPRVQLGGNRTQLTSRTLRALLPVYNFALTTANRWKHLESQNNQTSTPNKLSISILKRAAFTITKAFYAHSLVFHPATKGED